MNHFFITLGEFNIKITFEEINDSAFLYFNERKEIEIFAYLKNFVIFKIPKHINFEIVFTNNPNEGTIRINQNNKEYVPIFEMVSGKKIFTYYQISLMQFEIVLKKALYALLEKNRGFVIHSSSVKIGRTAYIFMGKSGAGKSTIAQLLDKKYQALSDDITFLRKINSKYYIFQTPFREKAWWIKKNTSLYELKNAFFINKSQIFEIKKITNQDFISAGVLSQLAAAQGNPKNIFKEALSLTKNFGNFYNLYFDKDGDKIVKLITKAVNEKI